ncbi:MAG TPA: alpha/beta hydrolase [Usitatibacter sp.]|nr:alpha/beta hydrolase [Usitatibacter sp.]
MSRETIAKRNNVRIIGEGQPLMFAHGFGCDQNMWRYVTPAFEHDYRIVLFDYVGCGKSDWSAHDPLRYGKLEGYAQDVVDIVEAFDLRDVIFVGHSVSSVIGLLASLQAPDRFERAILIGPSPCYTNEGDYVGGFERKDLVGLLDLMEKNYVGWASFLAPVVMKNPGNPELVQELQASFCATDPRVTRQFARATFLSDYRDTLAKVKIPTLIMQCSEDAIAPNVVGEYMHRELAGSTLRVMAATGHCPNMSHPAETIKLMREYLESVTA